MNIFEQAARLKLRFESKTGLLTMEQLWDLPLTSASKTSLDSIAIDLNQQLKNNGESFVAPTRTDSVATLKFEIVKHVIETRKAENTARLEANEKEAQRSRIQELIARKKDDQLSELSIEDLQKLLQ